MTHTEWEYTKYTKRTQKNFSQCSKSKVRMSVSGIEYKRKAFKQQSRKDVIHQLKRELSLLKRVHRACLRRSTISRIRRFANESHYMV